MRHPTQFLLSVLAGYDPVCRMSAITEYANDLERDLLQAHELLKGGLKHAIQELKRSAKEAGKKADSTEIAKLKALEAISDNAIDRVEERIGVINYLDAEEAINSLEEFDRLTNPLIEALKQAKTTINQVEKIGDELHKRVGIDLNGAWHELQVQLEVVRLHLALDALETDSSLKEIRDELASALAEAARKAPQDREQSESFLLKTFSTVGGLTKTAGGFLSALFDGTKK